MNQDFRDEDPYDIPQLLINLEKYFVPSEENSFAEYIQLFKGSNGTVSKEKLNDKIVSEFKNGEELDIFATLTAVKNNPEHSKFRDQILKFYSVYPSFPKNVAQISETHSAKRNFITSLVWTLYGGFTSQSLSNLLSKDNYLNPFLKFVFKQSSNALQSLSTRLLTRILPSQHSPQSFSHIWEGFVVTLPKEDQLDMVSLLLKKIGKSLWPSEDQSLAYESQYLLLSLLNSERWKNEILSKIYSALNEAVEFINEEKLIKAIHAGAIKFLSNTDGFGVSPFVLAVVSLKDTNFSYGIIKEVLDSSSFTVYSVIDDASAKVDINNIISIDSPGALKLVSIVSNESQEISSILIKV